MHGLFARVTSSGPLYLMCRTAGMIFNVRARAWTGKMVVLGLGLR